MSLALEEKTSSSTIQFRRNATCNPMKILGSEISLGGSLGAGACDGARAMF